MGKRTSGMKTKPEELEHEIESIRGGMDPVLRELDIRRHELTDWRLQLERHRPELVRIGLWTAGALVGLRVIGGMRAQMRRRKEMRRLRRALSQF